MTEVVDGLKTMLSDMYILYIKTQNFHWNVTGPLFQPLHTMFGDQYAALALSIDDIAERIRALGEYSPGSCSEFQRHSSIREATTTKSAEEMIAELAEDNERMGAEAASFSGKLSSLGDEVTAHMVADKATYHQKTAWMLKSQMQ